MYSFTAFFYKYLIQYEDRQYYLITTYHIISKTFSLSQFANEEFNSPFCRV